MLIIIRILLLIIITMVITIIIVIIISIVTILSDGPSVAATPTAVRRPVRSICSRSRILPPTFERLQTSSSENVPQIQVCDKLL